MMMCIYLIKTGSNQIPFCSQKCFCVYCPTVVPVARPQCGPNPGGMYPRWTSVCFVRIQWLWRFVSFSKESPTKSLFQRSQYFAQLRVFGVTPRQAEYQYFALYEFPDCLRHEILGKSRLCSPRFGCQVRRSYLSLFFARVLWVWLGL